MEKKLTALFDYQRFDPSSRLEKLIQKAESRTRYELSDDETEMVSAAGDLPKVDRKYKLNLDQKPE